MPAPLVDTSCVSTPPVVLPLHGKPGLPENVKSNRGLTAEKGRF